MNKQAQMNQVFIYLMVIIVVGAIALLGTKFIGNIFEDKCTVDLITFKDKLSETIALNNDYGSINEESLTLPCSYTTLVLIDTQVLEDYGIRQTFLSNLNEDFFVINQSVKGQVQTNAFLLDDKGETIEAGYIEQLELETPQKPLIITSRNARFWLHLEGQGRTTLVSEKQLNP